MQNTIHTHIRHETSIAEESAAIVVVRARYIVTICGEVNWRLCTDRNRCCCSNKHGEPYEGEMHCLCEVIDGIL